MTRPASGNARPAVLRVIGRPVSGKTALIERLILEFIAHGVRVATIKSVVRFDVDTPGNGSLRHTLAGAYAVASASQFAFVTGLQQTPELADLVGRCFAGHGLAIDEGFRKEARTAIEVSRRGVGHAGSLCPPERTPALVTDAGLEHEHRFGLDDAPALARHLTARRVPAADATAAPGHSARRRRERR